MTQKCYLKLTGGWLVFCFMFRKVINVQGNTGVTTPPDGRTGDNHAFFALRSCHQLLHSDGSEFFSPDYLCSNPPLWCNWTIQVDPGKRIHLSLEDLTPNETCHLKQDQIHVDEPAGHSGGHKVLQKCWQEAKYTSSSNTLYIVLLIGGWPTPTYRGFYGRYQAFGPPVVYNPQEVFTRRSKVFKPSALTDFSDLESDINGDQTELANSDLMYDYYDQHLTMTATLPWVSSGADRGTKATDKSDSFLGNNSHVYQYVATPTVPSSTQKTFRSGRGVVYSHISQADLAVVSESSQQQHYVSDGLRPSNTTKTQHVNNANKNSRSSVKGSEKGENKLDVSQSSDQPLHFSDSTEPLHTGHHFHHSNMVVPQPDNKGNPTCDVKSYNPAHPNLIPAHHLATQAETPPTSSWDGSAVLEQSWRTEVMCRPCWGLKLKGICLHYSFGQDTESTTPPRILNLTRHGGTASVPDIQQALELSDEDDATLPAPGMF